MDELKELQGSIYAFLKLKLIFNKTVLIKPKSFRYLDTEREQLSARAPLLRVLRSRHTVHPVHKKGEELVSSSPFIAFHQHPRMLKVVGRLSSES